MHWECYSALTISEWKWTNVVTCWLFFGLICPPHFKDFQTKRNLSEAPDVLVSNSWTGWHREKKFSHSKLEILYLDVVHDEDVMFYTFLFRWSFLQQVTTTYPMFYYYCIFIVVPSLFLPLFECLGIGTNWSLTSLFLVLYLLKERFAIPLV